MQKAQVVSIKVFRERLDKEGREQSIAYAMNQHHYDRPRAEEWYELLMKDIVEAAIIKGEVDPDLP